MPGITWPWKNTRSPPCAADCVRQKWLRPTSYIAAEDANEAMCPPYSLLSLLRRTTVAIAFQRLIARMRLSMSRSPGNSGWSSVGMVF